MELNIEKTKDLIAKILSSQDEMKLIMQTCPHKYGLTDYCNEHKVKNDDVFVQCSTCWKKALRDAK